MSTHGDDDFEYEDVDIKEALGLPDSLPPIRLLPVPELAALARKAPLPWRLHELAAWAGADGRDVTEDGELTESGAAQASDSLGVPPGDLPYLWEYALAVEWLAYAEDADHDRVVSGDMARAWADGDDETVFGVWSSTLAAVLTETLIVAGPGVDGDWSELGLGDLDFDGQPMALIVLLFLARREGLTLADFTEVLWENASGDMPAAEAGRARARWLELYGDPVRTLLDKLADLHAVTVEDTVRLTPLSLAALHEQLADAGVDIPLLPATPAQMSGAQLLAMAEGVDDDEFEAESDAWFAARGADAGARELLDLAAEGGPGERMIAVAAVTRTGAAAEAAWRANLDVPELRAYSRIALAELAGDHVPPELEPQPEDVAWITTDLLALACDEEFPDPEEILESLREAVPAGQEAGVFDLMWRSPHPDVVRVLTYVGRYHPDKGVAKAARTAGIKAVSRRASGG